MQSVYLVDDDVNYILNPVSEIRAIPTRLQTLLKRLFLYLHTLNNRLPCVLSQYDLSNYSGAQRNS